MDAGSGADVLRRKLERRVGCWQPFRSSHPLTQSDLKVKAHGSFIAWLIVSTHNAGDCRSLALWKVRAAWAQRPRHQIQVS